jgi:hypothetical protein
MYGKPDHRALFPSLLLLARERPSSRARDRFGESRSRHAHISECPKDRLRPRRHARVPSFRPFSPFLALISFLFASLRPPRPGPLALTARTDPFVWVGGEKTIRSVPPLLLRRWPIYERRSLRSISSARFCRFPFLLRRSGFIFLERLHRSLTPFHPPFSVSSPLALL